MQALPALILHYGDIAVFVAIFLEDFGAPTPGETTLILACLFASNKGMNVYGIAVIAWVAAILGDNVGYLIGRTVGRTAIARFGRYILITDSKLAAVERTFKRWGPAIVIISRFIEVPRQLNGIIAGIVRMPWPRFLAFNAVGAAAWVAFWTTLTYELGRKVIQSGLLFQRTNLVLVALAVATITSVLSGRILLRKTSSERAEHKTNDMLNREE